MAKWTKRCKYKLECDNFTFEYDTASELGRMAFESGSKMGNPYDPNSTEFDEFSDAYALAQESYITSKMNH